MCQSNLKIFSFYPSDKKTLVYLFIYLFIYRFIFFFFFLHLLKKMFRWNFPLQPFVPEPESLLEFNPVFLRIRRFDFFHFTHFVTLMSLDSL